ncbi:MAG: hypothetical protein WCK63_08545 [Betaproteobacteria bacterium]
MFNSTIPNVSTDVTQSPAIVRPAMPCMPEGWEAEVAAREAQEEAQERDAQIARCKARQAATEGAQVVSAARTPALSPALTNVIPRTVSTDVPIAVPSHVITPDVVPSVVSSAPVPTQSSKLMQVKDMLSKAASSDYTMSSAAIAPALSSAPLSSDSCAALTKDMQAKADAANKVQAQDALIKELVHKLHSGASLESLQRFGAARVAQAVQMQTQIPPTTQEVFTKRRNADKAANRDLGKGLKAAGVVVQQHKEEEFTHAICTQMDLQLQGENPSASAVLAKAFSNPAKAKSIGNSTRMPRVRKAFKSEAVQRHPIEQAMQANYGRGRMKPRCSVRRFSQVLGMNAFMFEVYSKLNKHDAEIAALKADVVATKARVQALELQSKAHDVLSATGVRTKVSTEELLALRADGLSDKEIGMAVGMKPDAVKKRFQRIDHKGK